MAIGLKSNINRIQCKSLRAISDKIIVHNMDFGGQTLDLKKALHRIYVFC